MHDDSDKMMLTGCGAGEGGDTQAGGGGVGGGRSCGEPSGKVTSAKCRRPVAVLVSG